ncbi:MAG: hypothetical protein P4M02_04495 [Clostridia bacterium]|nr:hypothetical protein [Clostridia bacterium]
MKWVFATIYSIGLYTICFALYMVCQCDMYRYDSNYIGSGGIALGLNAQAWEIIAISLAITTLAFGIVNYIVGIRSALSKTPTVRNTNELRRIMMFSKLTSVPFFIINFIISALVSIGVSMVIIVTLPIVLLIFTCISFLTMCFTSAYSVSTIVSSKKLGMISNAEVVIFTILQYVFIADIISSIVLFFMLKSRSKQL